MRNPYPLYLTGNTPGQFWGLVGIVAFIAIMALSFFLLKRLQNGALGPGGPSRRIKALERMAVGRDTFLQVIQVGSRLLLISVGRDGARLLCELSPEEYGPAASTPITGEAGRGAGFGARFWHNMKVNMGLLPKGTPYTTGKPAQPGAGESVSFDAVLRKAAEQETNPISEHNQRSGHRHAGPAPPGAEPPPPAKPPNRDNRRTSYQNSIDHMASLREPDSLDRRAKPRSPLDDFMHERDRQSAPDNPSPPPPQPTAPPQAPPPTPPAQPPREEGRREERIDALLDMIADRQSRYKERDKDKP